jgi:hypothetical protein
VSQLSVPHPKVRAALTCAVLLGLFLFASTPGAPPSDPVYLPWYLGGLGFGLFFVLVYLRLIRMLKTDFEADCSATSSSHSNIATTDIDPVWKRWVRAVYSALFLLVWLDGLAFFYVHGTSVRDGSTLPTATHSERLEEHGRVVYITLAEHRRRGILLGIMMAGIPLMLVSAFVLQNLIGVRLFPTRRDQ